MPTLAARSPVPKGFKIGDNFKIRGEEYVLTSVSNRSLKARLRPRTGGNDITLHANELVEWSNTQSVQHISSVSTETRNALRLTSLDPEEKRAWERRCEYLQPLLEYEIGTTRPLVIKLINKVFQKRARRLLNKGIVDEEKKPGVSTVYGWLSIVVENNGQLAAVAFKNHRHRPRIDRLAPQVAEIVEAAIDMHLIAEDISLVSIHNVVKNRVKSANSEKKRGEERLKTPSKTTVRNRLKNRNSLDVDQGRHGERHVIKSYNYGGKTKYGKFIGSRVESDTNYIDCLVFDPIINITYRPLLLLFIDCYTRAVVGYEVSYLQRGAEKLARAMTNMMSESNDASYSCIPVMVVVDNGKEFDNLTLKHIQDRTGIVFCFSPPYMPNCKAMIERFWGTLNTSLLHGLKGTTKSGITARGYYESEGLATYTVDELREKIDQAINHYHHATHSAEWLSPKTMWADAIADRPPRVYDKDTCVVLGSMHKSATVSHGRVEFESLFWRNAAMPENFNKQKVTVCINESDLTNVWVINPNDPEDVYKLDPVDPEFQTGMSLDFWRSYKKARKEREAETGNPEEASRLRYEITTQLHEESASGKGQTKRKRARNAHAAAQQLAQMSENIERSLPPKSNTPNVPRNSSNGSNPFTAADIGIED